MTVDKDAHHGLWCATAELGDGGVENGQYYEPVEKAGSEEQEC